MSSKVESLRITLPFEDITFILIFKSGSQLSQFILMISLVGFGNMLIFSKSVLDSEFLIGKSNPVHLSTDTYIIAVLSPHSLFTVSNN